jgi:sulfate transport system ATP-binding protein
VTGTLSDTAKRMAMLPADIPRDAVIVTRNLQRDYDIGGEVVHALRGVDLTIRQNEFVAIMGPSGSGKSTLMNLIGCLDSPTGGEYWLNGHRVSELEDDELARIRNREIGFVFQTFNLLPRASALHNVELPLIYAGLGSRERREQASEALTHVGLADRMQHRPNELSGGQRQRVALARALAIKPKVLLLDEPFGALDAKVRKELRRWLRRLHEEVHVTSVFVTHDQEEALEVSDRVVVMNEGRIEQSGTPEEVYERPASPFVYSFLGDVNLFHGRIERGRVKIGENVLDAPEWAEAEDQAAVAYVRTFEVEVAPSSNGASSIEAVVRHIRAFGPVVRLELDRVNDGKTIEAHVSRTRFEELGIRKGERVFVSPTNARVFIDNA